MDEKDFPPYSCLSCLNESISKASPVSKVVLLEKEKKSANAFLEDEGTWKGHLGVKMFW